MIGAFALSIWAACALAVLLIGVGVVAFQRAGEAGPNGMAWRGALAVAAGLLAWIATTPSMLKELTDARRALEVRMAELTARAVLPGSALSCLDAVTNATLAAACEKVLFANPETVAAAETYTDAKIGLLADAIIVATYDRTFQYALDSLRRPIEADRYGFVAQVFSKRGCNVADCKLLKLLQDPRRVLANLKDRTYETNIAAHAAAWRRLAAPRPSSVAPDSLPPTSDAGPLGAPPVASQQPPAGTTGTSPVASRFEFPSSSSIPPISIMSNEPGPSASEGQPEPAREPVPRVTHRRPAYREVPPEPPLQVAPTIPSEPSGRAGTR